MNKQIQCLSLIAFFVLIMVSPARAAEIKAKLGMWKWTTTMEVPGMPFAMPAITYSECLTKEDLIPEQPDKDGDCKILENEIKDNKVEWKMECNGEDGKVISDGKISYSNTSAKGDIKILMNGMKMTSKLSGQYTGACNK